MEVERRPRHAVSVLGADYRLHAITKVRAWWSHQWLAGYQMVWSRRVIT